jgi:hypothetical protein
MEFLYIMVIKLGAGQEGKMDITNHFSSTQIQFRHPFTMIISGSTGSGKSEWLLRLLRNFSFLIRQGQINLILYCYGELNPNILQLQRLRKIGEIPIITLSGFPKEETIRVHAEQTKGHLLIILDDLMTDIGMHQSFLDSLFTRGSHNLGISLILLTQHLFTKELRISRNNAHYLILMRNPAGALQIRNLAVQLFPSKTSYFLEAYGDATKNNFGYLLIDMHPSTPDPLRLRTNIYPDDDNPITIYLPK